MRPLIPHASSKEIGRQGVHTGRSVQAASSAGERGWCAGQGDRADGRTRKFLPLIRWTRVTGERCRFRNWACDDIGGEEGGRTPKSGGAFQPLEKDFILDVVFAALHSHQDVVARALSGGRCGHAMCRGHLPVSAVIADWAADQVGSLREGPLRWDSN